MLAAIYSALPPGAKLQDQRFMLVGLRVHAWHSLFVPVMLHALSRGAADAAPLSFPPIPTHHLFIPRPPALPLRPAQVGETPRLTAIAELLEEAVQRESGKGTVLEARKAIHLVDAQARVAGLWPFVVVAKMVQRVFLTVVSCVPGHACAPASHRTQQPVAPVPHRRAWWCGTDTTPSTWQTTSCPMPRQVVLPAPTLVSWDAMQPSRAAPEHAPCSVPDAMPPCLAPALQDRPVCGPSLLDAVQAIKPTVLIGLSDKAPPHAFTKEVRPAGCPSPRQTSSILAAPSSAALVPRFDYNPRHSIQPCPASPINPSSPARCWRDCWRAASAP